LPQRHINRAPRLSNGLSALGITGSWNFLLPFTWEGCGKNAVGICWCVPRRVEGGEDCVALAAADLRGCRSVLGVNAVTAAESVLLKCTVPR
jgi:hypothetical protein